MWTNLKTAYYWYEDFIEATDRLNQKAELEHQHNRIMFLGSKVDASKWNFNFFLIWRFY